jgi:integrase
MPLTDVAIRAARAAEKPVRLYDSLGLYLELSPAGGRWWRFKYRVRVGDALKEKRLSFGTYPEVGLKLARERRDEARRLVSAGKDPGAERKRTKADQATAAVFTVRAAVATWLEHQAPRWTAGTKDAIEGSFNLHVFPQLGDVPAGEIKAADIRAIVKTVDAAGRGDTAARLFQRLRSVFRYAVGEEKILTDPTYALKPADFLQPRKVRHRAALPLREMPAFLERLDSYAGGDITRLALQLLVLTAVRPAELRGGEWAEIDWDHSVWRIPAERMKMATPHLVPLAKQAVAVLRRLQDLTGAGALMFPSPFYPGKPLSDGTLNSALARMGYKGMATAHGFRTTFSTAANEAGYRADVIERQLSHEERDAVRAAYNHAQYLGERVELMQWWADRLDQLRAAT